MNAYALMESPDENKTLVVKNGVFASDEEKENIMNIFHSIFAKIKDKYLTIEYHRYFIKEKLFYYSIISNDKDKYGREMISYFIWDEKCEEYDLKKTADALNIDCEKILKYWNKKAQINSLLVAVAILFVLAYFV